MANNPINLLVRFILELAGLFALGYWGWTQHTGALRILLAVGLPLLAAAIWGVFRVPGHPGNAPVAVPGMTLMALAPTTTGVMLVVGGEVDGAAFPLASDLLLDPEHPVSTSPTTATNAIARLICDRRRRMRIASSRDVSHRVQRCG
jgi:hypothetical protein